MAILKTAPRPDAAPMRRTRRSGARRWTNSPNAAHGGRGGSAKSRGRHVARGKLLARERVARLIDPARVSRDRRLGRLCMYEGDVHGAGLIAGIGRIDGREAMIVANDPTIKGGAYYP